MLCLAPLRHRVRKALLPVVLVAPLALGILLPAGAAEAASGCPRPDNTGNVAVVTGTETAHLPGSRDADFCGERPAHQLTQIWNDGPAWNVKRLVVPEVGTWQITPTGEITFTADPAFVVRPAGDRSAGHDAMLKFKVLDADRHFSAGLATVYVLYPGTTARPDAARTAPGQAVELRPLRNDVPSWTGRTKESLRQARFQPSSLTLVGADGPKRELATSQGTWRLGDRVVSFTPAAGFIGATDPVRYHAVDTNGESVESTMTVTVGDGAAAVATGDSTSPGEQSQVAVAHTDGTSPMRAPVDVGPASRRVWIPVALASMVAASLLFGLRRRRHA